MVEVANLPLLIRLEGGVQHQRLYLRWYLRTGFLTCGLVGSIPRRPEGITSFWANLLF